MMYKILPALALIAIAGIEMAYAENYTVEMTENGFSQTSLSIADGDSVTFVNTHVKANGNIEPHAISDPFASPYTELSYWILSNSETSHTYTLDCDGYEFFDRFFDVPSIVIECGTSAPEYTGGYTLLSLQEELAELSADLNLAIEEAGILQNSVTNLNGIISDLESDVSERDTMIVNLEAQLTQTETTGSSEIAGLQNIISTLETEKTDLIIERDGWKQLSDNWYAVALEQVRVMVEILGL
jgi:plastocyanin